MTVAEVEKPTEVPQVEEVAEKKEATPFVPSMNLDEVMEPICEKFAEPKKAKALAKIHKMGGKRGVEIEGQADLGGLQFFCNAMNDAPFGADLDTLVEGVRAMNFESDPSEEERKGGSGKIGKAIFSSDDSALCIVAYVPSEKSQACDAVEWLKEICLKCMQNSSTAGCDSATFKAVVEASVAAGGKATFAKAKIVTDSGKGLFPIKMKDAAIGAAYAYLRERDLFPTDDDEDDDDFVFGDEDFPSM